MAKTRRPRQKSNRQIPSRKEAFKTAKEVQIPSREEAFKTAKEVTDFIVKLSLDSDERERFLRDPQRYLADAVLSERAREILGSLNERLIMGEIYKLRPDLTPLVTLYTWTSVVVDLEVGVFVITIPTTYIVVFLTRAENE